LAITYLQFHKLTGQAPRSRGLSFAFSLIVDMLANPRPLQSWAAH